MKQKREKRKKEHYVNNKEFSQSVVDYVTSVTEAFAYFTQISYYAFLRRIAKEKRQQDIKELYIDYAGAGAFMDTNKYSDSDSIIERIRVKTAAIRDRDNKLKEFGKKIKNKAKRKVIGPLDQFFKD
jgi:hypothetical protein